MIPVTDRPRVAFADRTKLAELANIAAAEIGVDLCAKPIIDEDDQYAITSAPFNDERVASQATCLATLKVAGPETLAHCRPSDIGPCIGHPVGALLAGTARRCGE